MPATTMLLLPLLMACSDPLAPARPTAPPPPPEVQAAPVDVGPPIIQARFRGWRGGKPPLAFHHLDIQLRNPAAEPRWLLIPSTFPHDPAQPWDPTRNEECELQPYLLSENPRVLWIYGVCADFHAVQLPGGGTLEVDDVTIDSWWSDIPATVDLHVQVVRDLRIGGETLDTLLGLSTLSATGAHVKAHVDAGDSRGQSMWHPALVEGVQFPTARVTLELERSTTTRVAIVVDDN